MRRRTFIQHTGMLTLGVSIAPTLLGQDRPMLLPALAEPSAHVRHGLFQSIKTSHPFLPSWVNVFQPHRFMKNGVSLSGSDLHLYSFSCAENLISVGIFGEETHLRLNDAEQKTATVRGHCVLYNDGINALLITGRATSELKERDDALLMVLRGSLKVDRTILEQHEFSHQSGKAVSIETHDGCIALLIKQLV